MRLLLAVQRGDRAAVERAFAADLGAVPDQPPSGPAAVPTTGARDDEEGDALVAGCRAVIIGLRGQSARHNGECCLVVRRENDSYGVCCDSGAALRIKSVNLKTTPGAPALTTRDALWFACTLLPQDSVDTTDAHKRREVMRFLLQKSIQQMPPTATHPANHTVLCPVSTRSGPMRTTPLLECCCAGAFLAAGELVYACKQTSQSHISVPVGAGPAAGATPLLVACSFRPAATLSGDISGDVSSDEDEECNELSHKSASVALQQTDLVELATLVKILLDAGADVNAADACGRTPALACIVNGQVQALKVLLASNPPPRLDARCKQSGLSPLAAVWVMGTHDMGEMVEATATAQGLRDLAVQERRAANTSVLMDKIISKVENEAERLDLVDQDEDSERTTAAILLMELDIVEFGLPATGQTATDACIQRVERMLDSEDTGSSNPLEIAVRTVLENAPDVHRKAWASESFVNIDDQAVLVSLQAAASGESRPLLTQMAEPYLARAAGSESWLVSPECHRFNTVCLRPLQRLFSCAIPTAEALQAIVNLDMPVVEVGCGSGYWARLLRGRGVDVLAFDLHPPRVAGKVGTTGADSEEAQTMEPEDDDVFGEEDNIFGAAWIDDIKEGDATAAGCESAKDCLKQYTGNTVIYVGDWTGRTRSFQPQGMTSSPAFQEALQKEFICETWNKPIGKNRIDTGKWPMIADELTIWRRKDTVDDNNAVAPQLNQTSPSNLMFCANCHFDEAPLCGEGKRQRFCSPLCQELRVQAERAKAAVSTVRRKRACPENDQLASDGGKRSTGLARELVAAAKEPLSFMFGFR